MVLSNSNIFLLVVVVFLLLTLVVGLCCNVKVTTFRGYAVGNKRFHTAVLVATLLATQFDAGVVRRVVSVHQLGLYLVIFSLVDCISFWMISLLALRMAPFMGHLSVAETMGRVYGKYPRVITALSNICAAVFVIAAQISVVPFAIGMCIDSVDSYTVTLCSVLILIAYTAFGGIHSVTITDVLQFITFTIIIALLVKFMFAKTGKTVVEIISFLPTQKKFQFGGVLHVDNFDIKPIDLVEAILSGLVVYIGNATVMQRVYMASGPIQVKKVFLYTSLGYFFISFSIVLLGVFVFVRNPALPPTEVWNYILVNIPPFFKGCVAIGLLAMVMSTADSYLHICSVMVSHDLMESIRWTKRASFKIWLAKLATLFIGIVATMVALHYKDLKELYSLYYNFYAPIVTIPFFLAVLGFRSTSRTALIGMVVGALTSLVWNLWVNPGQGDFFASTSASGLAMMAAHYLLPQPPGKGWVGLDDQQKRMQHLIGVFKKYKKMKDVE